MGEWKNKIKESAISRMQFDKKHTTKEERKAFMRGVDFVLNHYLLSIEEMWDSLSYFEREDLADRSFRWDDKEAEGYEDVDEAWQDLTNDDKLEFLCEKMKEFYAWEIKRKLHCDEIIKELYAELV